MRAPHKHNQRITAIIAAAGAPGDFKRPGADKIVSAVQDQLKSKGPMILMHDGGGGRSQSVEALEKLLPWLKEQGYGFSFPKVPEAG